MKNLIKTIGTFLLGTGIAAFITCFSAKSYYQARYQSKIEQIKNIYEIKIKELEEKLDAPREMTDEEAEREYQELKQIMDSIMKRMKYEESGKK